MWNTEGPWCFVHGGKWAEDTCPGAKRWKNKDIFYTKDAEVCRTKSWPKPGEL